ncbi:F-box/LRR-repeat protein At2g40920 [Brassica rapa]|uniref:F-box/LRR-repeat protein At2g40920 n=1 Tax=Brassica campestris TaxID=3711 RepID=UPI0004F167BC|nr:F-box/LRR-repeat protein At2g40920 [Brassica rapa]
MAFTELPMDLVTEEILTRLPVKSLMRFMCVSKLWLTLISSRYFTHRFLTVPSPRLYMCLWDVNNYLDTEILSSAPQDPNITTTTTTPSAFLVDHDLTTPRMGSHILQNLGGFMCYVYWNKPRIYNPATRQLVTIPFKNSDHMTVPPGGKKIVSYYFGYDALNHKYKVISSISVHLKQNMEVISSENWKDCVSMGLYIYYMALLGPFEYVFVSFDVKSEEFNMIQVPRRDGDELLERFQNVGLLEYGGKPTLFDQTNLKDKGVVALWSVEDAGSKKWSCKSLVVQPSQLHLVNTITFNVKGTTQNGKVLLIPKDFLFTFQILSYDIQNNDMRKIEIRGIPDRWFNMDEEAEVCVDVMFMDQSESVISSDFVSSLDWTERDNHDTSIHRSLPLSVSLPIL